MHALLMCVEVWVGLSGWWARVGGENRRWGSHLNVKRLVLMGKMLAAEVRVRRR
jgi:hypothetical protein